MSAPQPQAKSPAARKPANAKHARRPAGRQIHPQTARLWGNFRQTYSMAGIINVATRLSEKWEDVWCRVSS
jgi:hypothetical protein